MYTNKNILCVSMLWVNIACFDQTGLISDPRILSSLKSFYMSSLTSKVQKCKEHNSEVRGDILRSPNALTPAGYLWDIFIGES